MDNWRLSLLFAFLLPSGLLTLNTPNLFNCYIIAFPCRKRHATTNKGNNIIRYPKLPTFNDSSPIPKNTKYIHKSMLFAYVFPVPPPPPQMSRNNHIITTTRIHIMALDGIVNVNSLFTLALFLGLAWYPTTPDPNTTLVTDASCTATSSIAEDLIAFHVYSFSSFLFSSLVALAVKQTIKLFDSNKDQGDSDGVVRSAPLAHVNLVTLRVGTLVSGFGSVFGCGFLMMALVDLVQIKLGILGCGSLHTFAAITPLVILVPLALVFYVFLVLYAFTR